jgi:hypothetical protein
MMMERFILKVNICKTVLFITNNKRQAIASLITHQQATTSM